MLPCISLSLLPPFLEGEGEPPPARFPFSLRWDAGQGKGVVRWDLVCSPLTYP
jgi:hypothetical protein